MKKYSLSPFGIDQYLYAVEDSAWKIINRTEVSPRFEGWPLTASPVAPLRWYISTGRIPTPFLKTLLTVRPDVIARLLLKGGTDDDIIARIRSKLDKMTEA